MVVLEIKRKHITITNKEEVTLVAPIGQPK